MRVKIVTADTNLASLHGLVDEVAKTDPRDLDTPALVLVKDNFSLTFERDILSRLQRPGTFHVDVLSFSRLLSRLLTGPASRGYLTNAAGIMVVSKLMFESAAKFACYRSPAKLSGFAEKVYELIVQCKQCGITPEALSAAAGRAPRHLAAKLSDLALVYAEYEKFVGSRYYDSTTKTDLLIELVKSSAYVASANVFLANFDSYTEKDYAAVRALMAKAKSVTLCCVTGREGLYPNTAAARFREMAESLSAPCEVVALAPSLSGDLKHLAENMYAYGRVQKKRAESVSLFSANDVGEEVERIAQRIRRLAMNGTRYNRIGVVCQDLDGYRLSFRRVFDAFRIPYFLDDGMRLAAHPAVGYLTMLMELKCRNERAKGWQLAALAKSPLAEIPEADADRFENYVIKFGVNYGRLYEPFRYPHAALEAAERVRGELAARLAAFYFPPADSVSGYCDALGHYFEAEDYEAAVERYRAKLEEAGEDQRAAYTEQVFEKLTGVLAALKEVFGPLYLTAEDFMGILASGLSTTKISLIPLYADAVFVGSINDCKFLDVDALFVAGCTESLIPVVKKDLDLLSEEDVARLASGGLSLHPRLDAVNRQERFNAYMTMLVPLKELTVSYPRVGSDGRETAPSRMVGYLNDMFEFPPASPVPFARPYFREGAFPFGAPRNAKRVLAEKLRDFSAKSGDEQAYCAAAYLALKTRGDAEELDALFSVTQQPKLSAAAALFFPNGTASATKLETYYQCPFKHFVRCGLVALARERYGFDPADSGTYLHRIVELYTGKTGAEKLTREASDALVDEITALVTGSEKYAYYKSSKVQSLNLTRLAAEARRVCWSIYTQLARSRFRVAGRETYFGGESGLPVGGGVTLSGVIDRYDVYGDYCRIVDYKTGRVTNSLSELYTGKKLQLYLYQQVLRRRGLRPCGAFYFPVHNEFTPGEDSRPDYRLIGSVLDSGEVLSAMDTGFTGPGESEVLPLKRTAKGDVRAKASALHLVAEDGLVSLGEYAEILAGKAVAAAAAGDIRVLPAEGACEYCEYRDVCRRDEETEERKLTCDLTVETIGRAVEKWKSGR